MDSGLQSTGQAIRCSHVCTASTLAIDITTNKQEGVHCVISLTYLRVFYIGMKRGNRNPDIRVILILHVAVLIRNIENNKDMTEITNKYYFEEFNLIGSFNSNTRMFSNSSLWNNYQIQRVKAINFDYKNGGKKIRAKQIR